MTRRPSPTPALCQDQECRPLCRDIRNGVSNTCHLLLEARAAGQAPDRSLSPRGRTVDPLEPGWSRPPVVLPCPRCRNRAYSVPAEGFPWRRCDGPAGCGHTWNPESDPSVPAHITPEEDRP